MANIYIIILQYLYTACPSEIADFGKPGIKGFEMVGNDDSDKRGLQDRDNELRPEEE